MVRVPSIGTYTRVVGLLRVPRADRNGRRRRLAGVFVLSASGLLGCTTDLPPGTPFPTIGGPTPAAPSASAPGATGPVATPPASSPPTPAAMVFAWAARPDGFPGEDGATLSSIAVGPAGIVALSARNDGEGSPSRRLWRSMDALSWQPIDPHGLGGQVFVSGLWAAGGQYWLRGHFPDSDDPGRMYRSSDGLTWRVSRNLSQEIDSASVVDGCSASMTGGRDACPIFITGSRNIDGAIWRSTDGGASWARTAVGDATGWSGAQAAAPVDIMGIVATTDGLLAYGNGLANASDTGGQLQARFWRSADEGRTWTRVPNEPLFGELFVHDVVAQDHEVFAVGEPVDESLAVALKSIDGGRTWTRSATASDREHGGIAQVLVARDGYLGLGFANPAGVDSFPVREFVWSSNDGESWQVGPDGALEGGIVDDAASFGDGIIAVGRGWTTAATGTWEAPFGPAVWTLEP